MSDNTLPVSFPAMTLTCTGRGSVLVRIATCAVRHGPRERVPHGSVEGYAQRVRGFHGNARYRNAGHRRFAAWAPEKASHRKQASEANAHRVTRHTRATILREYTFDRKRPPTGDVPCRASAEPRFAVGERVERRARVNPARRAVSVLAVCSSAETKRISHKTQIQQKCLVTRPRAGALVVPTWLPHSSCAMSLLLVRCFATRTRRVRVPFRSTQTLTAPKWTPSRTRAERF